MNFKPDTTGFMFLNKRIWFLIILLSGINIVIILNVSQKNKLLSNCFICWQECKNNNTKIKNFFIERERMHFESSNLKLSDTITLLNLDENICNLNEIVDSAQILVFRFTASHCQSCIDVELQRINKYFNNLHPSKLIFMVSGYDTHSLKLLKEQFTINSDIYIVDERHVSFPAENYDTP
jgi:hypothetical protein